MKIKKFIELLKIYGDYESEKITSIFNTVVNREKHLYFTTDSRDIRENSVFIAIKGENTDGHKYVNDCFENGAVISIVEEYGDYKGFCIKTDHCIDFINKIASGLYSEINPFTIALTGSNGKTSTKEWIFSILQYYYDQKNLFCNPGNKNSEIGLPVAILNGMNTDKKISVLEMGMAKLGDIDYLKKTYPPDYSILLNIGTAHIGNTGNLENTFSEKIKILNPDKPALINISDPIISKHYQNLDRNKLVYQFGFVEDISDKFTGIYLKAFDHKMNQNNDFITDFTIKINNAEKKLWFEKTISLKGIFHKGFLLNLCAAFTVLYTTQKNIAFLEKVDKIITTINGRFVFQKINDNLIINDFYNSSIESLDFALDSIKKIIQNSGYTDCICVLGSIAETGKYREEIHINIGSLLNKYDVGEVILYTKNKDIELISKNFNKHKTYSEDSQVLSDEIVDNIKNNKHCIYLFKASRSIQLEEVYENVLESFS